MVVYWHDTGHAQIKGLGIINHREFLQARAEQLYGFTFTTWSSRATIARRAPADFAAQPLVTGPSQSFELAPRSLPKTPGRAQAHQVHLGT